MASKYWIKLYHEILDDPKMGMLDDYTWRLAIEIFLVCGENENNPMLPPVKRLAWRLRKNEEVITAALHELERVGIVHLEDNAWIVTHFEDRQGPVSDAERMRRYRERNQSEQYHVTNPVTIRNAEEEEESEIDTDKESSEEEAAPLPSMIGAMEAQGIFTQATGMATFPATSRADDIERIIAIYSQQQDKTVGYLKRYYGEWVMNRKYSKSNTGWLDWAVAGDIPKKRAPAASNNNRPRKNAGTLAAARARLEAESGN